MPGPDFFGSLHAVGRAFRAAIVRKLVRVQSSGVPKELVKETDARATMPSPFEIPPRRPRTGMGP